MKKLLLFFAAFLAILPGFSQNSKITWGPELIRPKNSDVSVLIGSDNTSFYCLRPIRSFFKVREIALEKYSRTRLMLSYIKPLRMPEINGRELKLEKIFLVNGTLLVFSSSYDSDQDKNIAYVQKINAADGALLSTPKEIDFIVSSKRRNRGSFDFIISADSSKILITHSEPYDKYENEKFSYKLIDADANTLWSAALELPYKDSYFTISNYVIDNTGKVFMLASIKKERSERERKKPLYRYDLISYDPRTKALKETEISLGDKFISDISFSILASTNIAIGGFYSNKSEDGIAGTFFLLMDKENNAILSKGSKDLTTEFLSGFMSQRRAEKQNELYNYKVDYLVPKSNGGVYMVSEQYYEVIVTSYNPRGGSTTTHYYYYNDIIVASINPDASIAWVKRVPKMQETANDGGYYSSYSFHTANDQLYFIYNDNQKNLETGTTKRLKNGITRKMVTVMATMDAEGNLQRHIISEEKIYTRPKISVQPDAQQTLFYATKKRKYKFGIINYPAKN